MQTGDKGMGREVHGVHKLKEKHRDMYMQMALVAASASYANKLKVGALAVKDHRILSVGYNGTPPGTDNSCEDLLPTTPSTLVTKKEVIHAEMNAIYKMARDGQQAEGADMFITHAPCFECSKAILSVGIKRVWYRNEYRDLSGIEFLGKNGVEVTKC